MALISIDAANARITATDAQIHSLREWADAEIQRLIAERMALEAQIEYAYSVKSRITAGLSPEAIAKAIIAVKPTARLSGAALDEATDPNKG